jgi:hypothetical protein
VLSVELIICFILVSLIGLGSFRVLLKSNYNLDNAFIYLNLRDKRKLFSQDCNKIIPVICHDKFSFIIPLRLKKLGFKSRDINAWQY